MSLRYWLILTAIGAAFGASFAFNEVLLSAFGPLTVSFLRVAVGAAGCWLWILITGRRPAISLGLFAAIAVFGVFQFAAPFAILPLAQQHITSSTAGIANAMTPVATVLISHFWPGGERATLRKLGGVAFGVAGIVALTSRGAGAEGAEPAHVLFALCAPLCYGIALNLARRFAGLDPVIITAWAMTGSVLAIAPLALATEGMPAMPDAWTLAALITIGVGLTSATFIAMYSILPAVGATNLSLVTFVAPLSATFIGVLAFGEVLAAQHLAGMALILAGLLTIDGRLVRALVHRRPRSIRTVTMAAISQETAP
ncbi:MAG: DMT family transporter [Rhodospirillales bacterium]|jgi:drug/metabolite transporter (DMT)-like permease|nr:DMT family transporter [Rhodospirillales bacterium]